MSNSRDICTEVSGFIFLLLKKQQFTEGGEPLPCQSSTRMNISVTCSSLLWCHPSFVVIVKRFWFVTLQRRKYKRLF